MPIREDVGDILIAPPNTVIMHACNARGVWGVGFARSLRRKFPLAFNEYRVYCGKSHASSIVKDEQDLVGTCIITSLKCRATQSNARIYIASLITSFDYGPRVDPPDKILANTAKALESFKVQARQVVGYNEKSGIDPIKAVWAVKLNSGYFKVPWEQTKAVLERCGINIRVVDNGGMQPQRSDRKRGNVQEMPDTEADTGVDMKGSTGTAERQIRMLTRKRKLDQESSERPEAVGSVKKKAAKVDNVRNLSETQEIKFWRLQRERGFIKNTPKGLEALKNLEAIDSANREVNKKEKITERVVTMEKDASSRTDYPWLNRYRMKEAERLQASTRVVAPSVLHKTAASTTRPTLSENSDQPATVIQGVHDHEQLMKKLASSEEAQAESTQETLRCAQKCKHDLKVKDQA